MGDFSTIDEYTQGLLDTLERLKLYKPNMFDSVFNAALNNFGRPDKLYISPQAFKDLSEALYNGKKKDIS